MVSHKDSSGNEVTQTVEISLIPKGDIFRLVARSKLEKAEQFESWIFDEVLPDISNHGMYMTMDVIEQFITNPDMLLKIVTAYRDEKEKNKALTAENEALKDEIIYKDDIIIGFTDNIDLAEKRQRITQIIRRGGAKVDRIKRRWNLFYTEFEKKYHCNLDLRLDRYKDDFKPKLKNKMDVIEKCLKMIPQAYEVCCKLFESDVKELMREWKYCNRY